jgi:hypothetical protein
MSLPSDFQFSQSSLQDFDTCARRFELRYLQQLRWPALEAEPVQEVERLARLGLDFHRLAQQHLAGIPADTLTASLASADPALLEWWQNYLTYHPAELAEAQIYPELTLSAPLRDYRLLARFDLLAVRPNGGFLIIDWKTTQHKPTRDWLAARIQTRVYPYLLAVAGSTFNNGQPIDPAAIQMMYWYPATPQEPELFDYNPTLFRRDENFLSELIERVKHAAQTKQFTLVEDTKPCQYCVYRSFCNRGDRPGPLVEMAEEPQEILEVLGLDWEQVTEIEF